MLAFVSVISVIIMLSLIALPQIERGLADNASAGDGPKIVRGYVYDSDGSAVQGANVTIKILVGVGPAVKSTAYYDSTGADGLYSCTFGYDKWVIGDTIETTGKFSVYQTTNSTIAEESMTRPIQFVNVTLAFQIPEFTGMLFSSASFSILALTAIVCVLARNRRKGPAS
jgi:hypothetical protein